MFSADSYVSVSTVNPVIRSVINNKMKEEVADSDVMKKFKKTLREDLQERFCKPEHLKTPAMFASVLDPRFKKLTPLRNAVLIQLVYDDVKRQMEPLKV